MWERDNLLVYVLIVILHWVQILSSVGSFRFLVKELRMVIAILDDERAWLSKAENILLKYADENHLSIETLCFENGQDLLSYDKGPVDAAFIDIVLREENGIDIVTEINKQWPTCQIVYCTDYLNYAVDVYETNHAYFIVKSQMEVRIDAIMNKLFNIWRTNHQEVYYQVIKGEMTRFPVKDICYFERRGRVTNLVTDQGSYQIREKIDDIVGDLPKEEFSRCHSSFIVNLSFVDKKDRSFYVLKSGENIPISRSYGTNTKHDYLHWCSMQMD